ncbi:MAG: zf-HC2 domain-containing protein [Actinomycetota bacterium]
MTNDFDELLSAYIDGESSPEEVARVEADPELRAAADSLRALSGQVGRVPAPGPEIRSAHLAAALDAFDASAASAASGAPAGEADDGDGGAAGVTSLGARRRARDERRARGVPSWLGAAAAAVIVVGGAGYALQQAGGGDDDVFTAADTAEESGDAAPEVTESAEAEAATEEAMEEAESAQLFEDDSTDDAGEEDADEDAAADEAAPASTAAERSTTTAPGLFPDEIDRRRVILEEVPDPAEREELAAGELLPFDWSTCGPLIEGAEPVGYLPVAIGDDLGELLVFRDAAGSLLPVLVDADCNAI